MLHSQLPSDGSQELALTGPEFFRAVWMDEIVIDDLEAAFAEAERGDAVRGVLLTGAGEKSFVAGADISQFSDLGALEGERFARRVLDTDDALGDEVKVTVIAAGFDDLVRDALDPGDDDADGGNGTPKETA